MSLIYSVRWSNPYTSPPDGRPRTLLKVETDQTQPPQTVLDRIDEEGGPGCGWALYCEVTLSEPDPKRKWSKERKAETRRSNLRRRIQKKHPLFFFEIYLQELAARPAYFAGEDPIFVPLIDAQKTG